MRARCPRCARPCEQIDTPMPGEWFACDNCERGDSPDGSRALGPLTFSREEADEAQAARREAKAAWDKAVAACRAAGERPTRESFWTGCDWQQAAYEAGIGILERPAATAYLAAWQEAA